MGTGHGHGHGHAGDAPASASGRYVRRLTIAMCLGLVTLVAQVTVGLFTSSLALLSDSAHVFTDVLGVAMALVAILVARRSLTRSDRTFGMYRGEVFAALFNAVLLIGVAAWVLYEAFSRLAEPPVVAGLPVALVAVVGLVMNVIALMLLRGGAADSMNVRGAYLEVLSDTLGSLGVLVSGLVTWLTGWLYADVLIGVAIGLFVLPRAINLGRQALRVLFQHAPKGVDVTAMETDLRSVAGVTEVHDLHVWTLTSGMEVASAHLTTTGQTNTDDVLVSARRVLADTYRIEHSTLQVESADVDGTCARTSW